MHAGSGQVVLERYGMTETAMLVSNPYDGERRPGTVGFPLPGVSMRLVARDGGTAEIQVRGPNVVRSYLDDPPATAEAFTEDGWFRTGDLGSLDPDGYLRISGRAKELIITGGYNVYPREVEEVLRVAPRRGRRRRGRRAVVGLGRDRGRLRGALVGPGRSGVRTGRIAVPTISSPTSGRASGGWSTPSRATPSARSCATSSSREAPGAT